MRRDRGRSTDLASLLGRLPVPDYVALDLETTGLSADDDEILEVAMVRFSSGKPTERWSTLLNPGRSVPLKALRLTHIDESEVQRSPEFSEVMSQIADFRGDLPLVGHNSSFDITFLARRIEGFPAVPVYDTLELARIAMPGFKSYKLTDLARELGVSLNDAHRAYDDAEVSGVIFAMVQERVRSLGRDVRERVAAVMGREWEPGRIFLYDVSAAPMLPLMPVWGDAAGQVSTQRESAAPGVDLLSVKRRCTDLLRSGSSGTVVNIPLLPGVAKAAAEAAQEYAAASGQRLLLAGFPGSALPDSLKRAPVPEDYLCLQRFRTSMRLASLGTYSEMDIEERRFLASLAVWGEQTPTGSFDEIQIAGASYGVANEVACPKGMECRSTCPFAAQCYYLREEAGSLGPGAQFARLDRAIDMGTAFDRVAVWGAQELHRTWQYSERRTDLCLLEESLTDADLMDAVPSLGKLAGAASRDASTGLSTAETRKLAGDVAAQARLAAAALRKSLRARFALEEPGVTEAAAQPWADPPLVSRGLHFIERAAEALSSFASPSEGHLSLAEAGYGEDSRRGPFLVERSVWPARDAVRAMESRLGSVFLFSDIVLEARATEGGRRLLGIDAEAPLLDLGQPLELRPGLAAEQVPGMPSGQAHAELSGGDSCRRPVPVSDPCPARDLLVTSLDVKVPATGPAFAEHVCGLLRDLSLHVRKGLLALFPSRALIKEVYAVLTPELEKEGIVVYAQGVDGGRRVVEHLLDDNSIVLATSGGVPGDDEPVPSCLVVVKVPFPPPNPVDDARRKEISRAGADGFVEVNVRPSSLLIRGYAARMLASGGKRALVFGDPRLSPGQSRWASEFFLAFSGLFRESSPIQNAVHRVSLHLAGESSH